MEKLYNVLIDDSFFIDMLPVPGKVCSLVLERLEMLGIFPEMGVVVDFPRWKGYRQLIVDEYRILYSVHSDQHLVRNHFLRYGKMDIM